MKKQTSFAFVDIPFFNQDLADQLDIQKMAVYSYMGEINQLKIDEITNFIAGIGNNKKALSKKIATYIKKTAKFVQKQYPHQDPETISSMWLDIRAATPNDFWKIPRWHMDGCFYDREVPQCKIASVLKGAGTLFVKPRQEIIEKVTMLLREQSYQLFSAKDKNIEQQKEINMLYRAKLQDLLKKQKIYRPKNNQAAFFNVGQYLPAIHSEPYIQEPRLFFSFVLGNESQINELQQKWKR